jgi:trk system potassium uptake protein TrkH
VAAFCNAGFSLLPNSLEGYRGSVTINLILIPLMVMGGLGFTVLAAFIHTGTLRLRWKERRRISVHARLALTATVILLLTGALFIFFFEFDRALAPLSLKELAASTFQSASLRGRAAHLDPAMFRRDPLADGPLDVHRRLPSSAAGASR